ncbi:hypothetical protein L3X38_029675 [Prunus dulcis]|uniref:Uncharacterized protein n=1 Tax=Prunus dulcis TaxID=3755 RepID=A0AAD4Z1L0_PRUDU|nr:hypothetical protein L3X38_029675 [Prunus dulcis]
MSMRTNMCWTVWEDKIYPTMKAHISHEPPLHSIGVVIDGELGGKGLGFLSCVCRFYQKSKHFSSFFDTGPHLQGITICWSNGMLNSDSLSDLASALGDHLKERLSHDDTHC